MEKNTVTIWVCSDCNNVHHYGDNDGVPASIDPWSKDLADGEYTVTAGMLTAEHSCDWEDGHQDKECECEIKHFSSADCDSCNQTLAGARYAFTLWYN